MYRQTDCMFWWIWFSLPLSSLPLLFYQFERMCLSQNSHSKCYSAKYIQHRKTPKTAEQYSIKQKRTQCVYFTNIYPAFRTAPVQLNEAAAVPVAFALYGDAMTLSPSSSSDTAVVRLIRSSSEIYTSRRSRQTRKQKWRENAKFTNTRRERERERKETRRLEKSDKYE